MLQVSSYKFLGSFYETKLKTTLIGGAVLISCENCFFSKMHFGFINIYSPFRFDTNILLINLQISSHCT